MLRKRPMVMVVLGILVLTITSTFCKVYIHAFLRVLLFSALVVNMQAHTLKTFFFLSDDGKEIGDSSCCTTE